MKKFYALFASLVLIISSFSVTVSAESAQASEILESTASYIKQQVKAPSVASVGGEWAVLGLARSSIVNDGAYFSDYYERVKKYTVERGGVLHSKKYTEYSRVILALTSIGKNPRDVGGYDLTLPLGDFEKTVWQGINGPVWALIAIDSGNYEIPQNPDAQTQATREMYVDYILGCQLSDGGWALNGSSSVSDVDITAMTLCALSKYRERSDVEEAVQKALAMLRNNQNDDGGFASTGSANCESSAQVLTALCELGIAYNDASFTKNGNTVLDNLLSYYNGDGFSHIKNAPTNQMATEQAFYALVSLDRFLEGKPGLYCVTDPISVSVAQEGTLLLPEETAESGFTDITGHESQKAIEVLFAKGIINGKSKNAFEPYALMTRAEFATITVKALGADIYGEKIFEDVSEDDWFYPAVSTAFRYGIVKGVSDTSFNPYATVTRQEAAVMLARCAAAMGMDTDMSLMTARDILAEYTDYVQTAQWAVKELAFCCETGIIEESGMEISPGKAVDRAEIARMIYNLLEV